MEVNQNNENMDSEPLFAVTKANNKRSGEEEASLRTSTSSRVNSGSNLLFFVLALVAACGVVAHISACSKPLTTTTTTTPLGLTTSPIILVDPSLSSPPSSSSVSKRPHHGSVAYSQAGTKDGWIYKRTFAVPCDYGVLVFNIGPAPMKEPYEFEVYDDAYLWSDNNHLCLLYPHWWGYQMGPEPFWMPKDATHVNNIPLGTKQVTRISTKVNEQHNAQPVDKDIQKKGGDYVVMAKGQFWSPNYYDGLKAYVHSWKKDQDIQTALEDWMVPRMIPTSTTATTAITYMHPSTCSSSSCD
jgi:hypothetical protein